MLKRLLIAALLGLALLAGCGDSDDGDSSSGDGDAAGSDSPLAQAIAADIREDEEMPLSEEDAQCIGAGIVDGVGEDRLAELGITTESLEAEGSIELSEFDLTDDEVDAVVDTFQECTDVRALLAEALSADGTMSAEDAECVVGELPDDLVRAALEAGQTGDEDPDLEEEFGNQLLDAAAACDIDVGGS